MTGIVLAVGNNYENLSDSLVLGIGCQLPACVGHCIEQGRTAVVSELIDIDRKQLVVVGEVLRYGRGFGQPNHESEIRGVIQRLRQKLGGSLLLECEPGLHGAAGINHDSQTQRQLRLWSELQDLLWRLVGVENFNVTPLEANYAMTSAADAKENGHLIDDFADCPAASLRLTSGIEAASGFSPRE